MKPALGIRLVRYLLLVAAVLSSALWMNSCRNDEPSIPPLTGPSGHRLFITIEATPDHLQIVDSGKQPQVSHISAQLKNQLGQGVPGEHIRLQITDFTGQVVAIGSFNGTASCIGGDEAECTTDSGGFARADYVAPTRDESPTDNRIYIFALLTNPDYTFEVKDLHAIDLQLGTPDPGSECGPGGLNPSFTFLPLLPVVGVDVCFNASTTTAISPITRIVWDYDDGHGDNTGNLAPCHSYDSAGIYNVILTMHDQNTNICSTSRAVTVTSGLPPVCGSIIINPGGTINLNTQYTFTSLATDPDSGIKRYSWNFGDGSAVVNSSSNSVKHTFKKAGSFTLILTITDTQFNETICTQTISVVSADPTCSFVMLDGAGLPVSSGSSPLTVHFDATSSTDDGGFSNLSFAWDFGDSTLGAGATPTHAFSATCTTPCSQSFNVNLIVSDAEGNTSACSNSVTVTLP